MEPVDAERLVHDDKVAERLLRGADAAGQLEPDGAAGLLAEVADRLGHAERDRRCRCDADLAGRGLDHVGAGGHGEHRREADHVVGAQLADLEDRLEVGLAARRLRRGDLVMHDVESARQERVAVDHDVDLVGAVGDRPSDVLQAPVVVGLPRREGPGNRGDLDRRAREGLGGHGDERWVDADRRDRARSRGRRDRV